MKILQLDASVLGDASVTRILTAGIVAALKQSAPAAQVTYRDLGANPPDHLGAELVSVVKFGNQDNLSDAQRAGLALTETLLDEVFAADVVVIGAPMYNFTIPTQLKAWFDRIVQAGRTFRYTETGPVGLAGGRKVYIASARGGVYSTSDAMTALDHQESYLKTVLGFMGMTDVTVFRVEGVGMGPDVRATALAAAQAEIAATLS